MILGVNLEVSGEMFDSLTQKCDLHFCRAGVLLVKPELPYDSSFGLLSNFHSLRSFSLFPFSW